MNRIKLITGYILNSALGFFFYPLLFIAISDILGTAKGDAYLILEPELSAYRIFGIGLLLLSLLGVITSQIMIRVMLYKDMKKNYQYSLILFLIFMVLAYFTMK